MSMTIHSEWYISKFKVISEVYDILFGMTAQILRYVLVYAPYDIFLKWPQKYDLQFQRRRQEIFLLSPPNFLPYKNVVQFTCQMKCRISSSFCLNWKGRNFKGDDANEAIAQSWQTFLIKPLTSRGKSNSAEEYKIQLEETKVQSPGTDARTRAEIDE